MSPIVRLVPRVTLFSSALIFSTPAVAQRCLGGPSFANRPVQLGASASFGDDVTAFGGSVAAGRANGPFGAISAGGVVYDFGLEDVGTFNENAPVVGVTVGYQVPLGQARRAELCPVAAGSFQPGPNNIGNADIDFVRGDVTFGIALGGEVAMTQTLGFIPWARADVVYDRRRLTAQLPTGEFAETTTETYGMLTLGGSLLVNGRLSLGPVVYVPLGLEEADARFGVSVSLGLGGR